MQYKINDFSYNDETGKFIKNDDEIQLTKAQKKLLNYFISNPKVIISKQQLMDDVWGRVIAENSIEKAISKLRLCIEEDVLNPKILITHFGHGISFEAQIVQLNTAGGKDTKNNSKNLVLAILTSLFVGISVFYLTNQKPNQPVKKDSQTVALIMADKDDWLSSGSVTLLEQIMTANDKLLIKNKQNKPENLNTKQYIEYQWKLSPNLKIIKSKVEFKQSLFNITISITDAKQKQQNRVFVDENYNNTIKQASHWLLETFKLDNKQETFAEFLPQSNFIMEIYLRGLEKLSKGELKVASNYFDICIDENPSFLPAYLNLARVKSKQEELTDAMALLDTLSQLSGFSTIKTEVQILKARLYMQLNQQNKARDYLETILTQNLNSNKQKTYKIQSLLISIYINLNKNQDALNLIERLESELQQTSYPELLRTVYYNKARIMLVFGKYQRAKQYILKSKTLSSKLGDLFAESAAYRLLASIVEKLGNENDSILYLKHALAISKSLRDDIGIAKTISFLVPNFIKKGRFNDALKLNQEMESIVTKHNSNMGNMFAKINYAIIARYQKQWQKAEIYLKQHMEIVKKANNQRSMLENRQNKIELLLAQNKTSGVLELIKQVQQQIDTGGLENLQIKLNIKKARYYYLMQQEVKADTLLYESKKLAQSQNNKADLFAINLLIAKRFLLKDQASKALKVLTESSQDYKFKPYPYLLLKSKAYFQLGEMQKAIKLANECKSKANEFWSLEDEHYLTRSLSENKNLSLFSNELLD